jgi:hypothetical protein
MIDEPIYNNPLDAAEDIFVRLEEKFVDISHNISLLMAALANKFESFKEFGGSNSKLES